MANPFDQFDVRAVAFPAPPKAAGNPFDQFDSASADQSNPTPRSVESQPAPTPSTGADVAKSLVAGVARGGIGTASLPATIEQLYAKAGQPIQSALPETVRKIAGAVADYGGPLGAPMRMFSGGPTNKPTQEEITGVVEKVAGPLYQPKTVEGEYARTIGEFAPSAVMPGGAFRRAMNVVIPGAISETAGQVTKGANEEGLARVLGGVAGTVLAPAPSALGSRIAAPVRAMANPKNFAAEKAGEAIVRDFPVGGVERFSGKFQDMSAINPSVRMMDAGGENLRRLMRSANNMPNDARETARRFTDARQANQHARITDKLSKGMGDGRNYYDSVDDLAAQMDEIGSRSIQPALKKETRMTPELASVLSRPTTKDLQKLVERKLMDEGLPVGFETRTAMLHRLKVELDDQIGLSKRAEKMGNAPQAGMDTRTLTILKRDLLNAIDNPEYKNSLRKYASQAQLKNAAEDGYDAFNSLQPEEIRKALRTLGNDVEREFYRLGAQRAIIERVRKGNANNDRTDGVFSSPEVQLKLREIFPDRKALRNFQRELVVEAKMADSRKALQGNSTTAAQLGEGDQAAKNASMANQAIAAAGGNLQAGINFLAQGYNRFTGLTPSVAAEITRLGMSKDPATLQRMLDAGTKRAALNNQPRPSIAAGALPATQNRDQRR